MLFYFLIKGFTFDPFFNFLEPFLTLFFSKLFYL